MKIIVTMTADELNKGKEILSSMIPSIDQYIPNEREQVETSCNIYNTNYVVDRNEGIISEIDLKTHFVLWLIRKMKPFITTAIAVWHMFTDLIEDITIMAGDMTVIHNGVNLNEQLNNITHQDEDYEEDESYTDYDVENSEQLEKDSIYTTHYNGKSEAEINEHIRFFFDTEEQAKMFITNDKAYMAADSGEDISNYKEICALYCHHISGIGSKNRVKDLLENSRWFEYRGFTIQKSDDRYDVIKNSSIVYTTVGNINEVLSHIDAKLDCKRTVWRVYSTVDKSANRVFDKNNKATDYFTKAGLHGLEPRLTHFEVPADFDFAKPVECTIKYRGYLMEDTGCDGIVYVIDGDTKVQHFSIFDAMDTIDELNLRRGNA